MIKPYLIIRAISGALIVIAGIMQAWNIYKTVTAGEPMPAARLRGRGAAPEASLAVERVRIGIRTQLEDYDCN